MSKCSNYFKYLPITKSSPFQGCQSKWVCSLRFEQTTRYTSQEHQLYTTISPLVSPLAMYLIFGDSIILLIGNLWRRTFLTTFKSGTERTYKHPNPVPPIICDPEWFHIKQCKSEWSAENTFPFMTKDFVELTTFHNSKTNKNNYYYSNV